MKIWPTNYKKELHKALKSSMLPLMQKIGYEYKGVSDISTKAIPNWYEGVFSNATAGRTVEISYTPKGKGTNEILDCHISCIDAEFDDFDYTSTNQMTVPCLEISSIEKELPERLKQVVISMTKELESNFGDILNGKHFKSENINWMGMK